VQHRFRFIDARRVVLSYHPFGFAERNYIFAGVFCGVSRAKDRSARNGPALTSGPQQNN
jgi:hypothetical protein